MAILLSQEIDRREHLADLCNRRRLLRHAVEIGTEKAGFATRFLETWNGDQLLCIDPWQNELPGYDEMHWDRSCDFHIAMHALGRYNRRVHVFQGTSEEAILKGIIRWPIDFLYIDANHEHEYVKRDIELFWPHVADGGVMAGHDYDRAMEGVVLAVNGFAERLGVNVYLTHEPRFKSWYISKTEALWADYQKQDKT
ncbi:MAG: class I SAM-dependent methyltransferase [Planctomycetes bacterium]|nr:class I SAM-dependent methyltransferase [Planctomycetota bacterium]